jgi:transposase
VQLHITEGQAHDGVNAKVLLEKAGSCQYVLADRAYDSDFNLALIAELGAEAIIPSGSGRVRERKYDKHIYKERCLVELFFNRLKQFRRLATRYEKTLRHFTALVTFAAALVCLA